MKSSKEQVRLILVGLFLATLVFALEGGNDRKVGQQGNPSVKIASFQN